MILDKMEDIFWKNEWGSFIYALSNFWYLIKKNIDLREKERESFLIVDILILYVYNRFDITGIRGWVVYVAV